MKHLGTVFVLAFVACFMQYTYSQGRKPARILKNSGNKVLEYSQAINHFMCLLTIVGAILLILSPVSMDDEKYSILLFLVFLPIFSYLECKLQIEVNQNKIVSRSSWRKTREILWEDIKSISFSGAAQWFVIKSKTGTKIRVPITLRGNSDFCKEMLSRLSEDKISKSAQRGFKLIGL